MMLDPRCNGVKYTGWASGFKGVREFESSWETVRLSPSLFIRTADEKYPLTPTCVKRVFSAAERTNPDFFRAWDVGGNTMMISEQSCVFVYRPLPPRY